MEKGLRRKWENAAVRENSLNRRVEVGNTRKRSLCGWNTAWKRKWLEKSPDMELGASTRQRK